MLLAMLQLRSSIDVVDGTDANTPEASI